ncbi:MAG: Gfo/Idh/MocA family oxidoreductase [Pirellulales bacterium]|nr:Gfo/Idh/MocA family oxidoreductase [Pirellulales bacterium]
MKKLNRRQFLDHSTKSSLGMAAGVTILSNAASVRGAPANEKVVLAAVGAGGRGSNLAGDFAARGDCQYAFVCDPETSRREALIKGLADKQGGAAPKGIDDYREALDDKSVDAVIVATPDHWHALASIHACQAGKDVYVEKPPTHNCWEGKKMIEAARKYKRIVQVGTQNRSAAYNMSAKKYLADGKLGKVYFCRIYNQKSWPNFPMQPEGDPPAGMNWDRWNGPAPESRYNPTRHRNWHHFWRYSSGDIINDAIHQIDLARWVLGVTYPKSVYSTGARYEEGAAETPDTQVALYDFEQMLVSFELTLFTPYMLKISPIIRQATDKFPYWPQCATRIEIYGTEGLMYLGRHGGGWQVFGRPKLQEGVVVAQEKGLFPDPEHKENFVQCIRSRQTPNADIEEGHRSVLLSHYATISYRLAGQKLMIDPTTEEIKDNPEAMKYFKREYRSPYAIPEEV